MIYPNQFDLIETTSCNYPKFIIGERNIEIFAENIYVLPPHPLYSIKTVNRYHSMSKVNCCRMRFMNVASSEREMREITGSREILLNNRVIKGSIWAPMYMIPDKKQKFSTSSVNLYEFEGCIYDLENSNTFRYPNAYQADVYWRVEAESFELEVDDKLAEYLLEDSE